VNFIWEEDEKTLWNLEIYEMADRDNTVILKMSQQSIFL
jgi:hypothetical protein